MADFGILKAIGRGAKGARVSRGTKDVAIAAKEAEAAAARKAAGTPAVAVTEESLQLPTAGAARQPGGPPRDIPVSPEPLAVTPPQPAPVASQRVLETGVATSEARRLSSLELGNYDLDAVHQINFDRLTTTDDVKAVIADVAERNKGKIEVSRRGVIGNEQLKLLAADLNVEEDVVRQVLERESGGVLNPETILASRQVLASSADRLLGLGKKIAAGGATDFERIQFRRHLQFHDDYQVAFMGARAETGRALNAFNIPVGAELDGQLVSRMRQTVDALHGNDTDELARMVVEMESVGQVNRFAKKYTRSKLSGVLQELFVNSILSGPKTQFVNTLGNALFQSMNVAEHGVAAQVGRFLPGADHVMVGEASAMLFGQLTGWRDAMRYASIAFREGQSVDAMAKFEGHTRRAISSHNLLPAGAPPSLAAAVDLIGNVVRIPTERLMVPTDEWFKTMAYRADLARQAYRKVSQRIAGGQAMTQDDIALHVAGFMENPPNGARKLADNFALYVTYQTELGLTGAQWQRAISSTPGMFIVAPFVKTPVNIFKAGLLERSPLAVFSANFREAIRKGGPERDLAVARVSMGSLTVAAVAAAAAAGSVTGGGPQDPGARRLLEATGWLPYSLCYQDPFTGETKYQSYARAEPLSYVIGATADLVEMRAHMNADDPLASDSENMNRAVAAVTAAVANNTMSKTFLQGVADFSGALDDPSRYMSNFVQKTTTAFLPYSSFRRQIGQMQDPLVREAWDYTDKLRATAGLAGYSEGLPPRRDIFGQPVEWKGGSVLGVMSPFPDSTARQDPVASEIVQVMNDSGSIPVTMPPRKIEGMRLTTTEYDQLVREARSEPNLGGETFRERLSDLFESSVYLLATPDMRAVLIKQVREDADKVGRIRLEQNNDDFARRLEIHRLKKTEQLFGPGVTQ